MAVIVAVGMTVKENPKSLDYHIFNAGTIFFIVFTFETVVIISPKGGDRLFQKEMGY